MARPPERVELRLTAAGRVLAVSAGAALLLSWALGGGIALAAAAGGALVLLAPLATWLQARSLRVSSPPPTTAFVGEAFPLEVPVENAGRAFAARDVVVLLGGDLRDVERTGGYLPSLMPGEAVRVEATQRLGRRGRHSAQTVVLVSTFPLGLARCRAVFEVPVDILVLPRLGHVRNLDRITAHRHGMLFEGPTDRGDEQEFHGIREWRHGESLRRVHWKLSARRGRRLLREFRGEDRPPVHVVLDRVAGSVTRPGAGAGGAGKSSFERAVSLAATLAEHYLRRQHLVCLTVPGFATLDRRRGRGGLFPVLSCLAEVGPAGRGAATDESNRALALALEARRADEVTVIVRAGGLGKKAMAPHAQVAVLDVDSERVARMFVANRRAGSALGLAR